MYKNEKIRHVETIPRMGREKKNDGVNLTRYIVSTFVKVTMYPVQQ
jgi:hypothetical protein